MKVYKQWPGRPENAEELHVKGTAEVESLISDVENENKETVLTTNIRWKRMELEEKRKRYKDYEEELQKAQTKAREKENELKLRQMEKEKEFTALREMAINLFQFLIGYIDNEDQQKNVKGLLNFLREDIESKGSAGMVPDQWNSLVKLLISKVLKRDEHGKICPVSEVDAKTIVAEICEVIEKDLGH